MRRRYKTKTVCKKCRAKVILTDFSCEGKAETDAFIKKHKGWICCECSNLGTLRVEV